MSEYLRTRSEVLRDMQSEVRQVNEANGWFESDRRFGEDIALLHSEVSEALEEYRVHGLRSYYLDEEGQPVYIADEVTGETGDYRGRKPLGVGSEFADVLVRLLDSCDRAGVDLAWEFTQKIAYNRTRGHRHGGRAL